MTSVSAGRIILTPTQPVGSGRPQLESNPGPPYQESRALPTELPRSKFLTQAKKQKKKNVFTLIACPVFFLSDFTESGGVKIQTPNLLNE